MNDDAFFYREEHGEIEEPSILEQFTTTDLIEELLKRDDHKIVYKLDDGKVSIDLNAIIPLLSTDKLVAELERREQVTISGI